MENHNIYIIIDDQEVNLFLLNRMIMIEDDNAIVFSCSSGAEGLEKFQECIDKGHDIKAVISDLQMPNMDGEETIRLMCEYYKRIKDKFSNEISCKFSIFTANDQYVKPSGCKGCRCEKECAVNIEYKPVTKEKTRRMLNL